MGISCLVVLVVACSAPVWSQDLIFADDFESGNTSAWSATVPPPYITVYLAGGVPLTLALIPSGSFGMGSPETERGRAPNEDGHLVALTHDYYVGVYEVTQAQWEAVMGTPMPTTCDTQGIGPSYPVDCVSWDDIAGSGGFVERLNTYLGTTAFRLPTEAEWERAARAGNQYRFSHGNVLDCDDYCGECYWHDQFMWWCGNNTPDASKPVGSKLPNGFGLYDVHGNVFELVQDWYTDHLGVTAVTDPTGPETGTHRVIRSGVYHDVAESVRSARRYYSEPAARWEGIGFRIARTAQ